MGKFKIQAEIALKILEEYKKKMSGRLLVKPPLK